MNDTQVKITFDISKCRTETTGANDVLYCRSEKQYLMCGYALPFGYGHICKHPQRKEFAEDRPWISPSILPSDTLE